MDTSLVNRLNAAVEFLKDGMTFKVGEYVLGVVNPNTIFVNGYSEYNNVQNLSKERATEELFQIKNDFNTIMNEAKVFLSFMKNKSIDYILVVDTGNAGLNVCKEKNGVLEFYI